MSDKLAVARLQVSRERPYYSAVLWALQPVPVKDLAKKVLGPIGVDQHLRLYYDPEAIEKWDVPLLAAVMVHEIGHVLRNHAQRQGGRNIMVGTKDGGVMGTLWNVAGDCEINDDLAAEKLPLKDAVYPSTFKLPDGLMAEEYYDLLQTKMDKVAMKGTGGGACGSCADGQQQEHELPGEGSATTPAGVSQAEQELIRQKVAQDVEAAAKNRGTVPAWLERWAKDRLKSKVDWRRVLAAYIRRAVGDARGAVDFTYQRLSRRSAAMPQFILPALRQPTPQVAVVVDTSGSMSGKELSQALAEIAKVLEGLGNRGVTVLSCDAAVHTTQKVFNAKDVKLAGGGGTDMTVGIAAAEKVKPRPHVIILVTDGETPYPTAPTRTPLIVARTQHAASYAAVPAWAKLVDVTPDGTK